VFREGALAGDRVADKPLPRAASERGIVPVPDQLQRLVDLFAASPKQVKVAAMVDYADRLPDPPPELVEEGALERVHECQTPFYVTSHVDADGKVTLWFQVPREAPTMRGYAGILAAGLNGSTVDEILEVPDTFYTAMGIEEVVSPLRMRGMGAILARIKSQLRQAA
jgi:cysteine desulfuration protein SufE